MSDRPQTTWGAIATVPKTGELVLVWTWTGHSFPPLVAWWHEGKLRSAWDYEDEPESTTVS